jgi:hypothetical protein
MRHEESWALDGLVPIHLFCARDEREEDFSLLFISSIDSSTLSRNT